MSFTGVEALKEATYRIALSIPLGIQTPYEDEILDSSLLEQANSNRAEAIALFVRKHGYYGLEHGPMWSELSRDLPNKRGLVNIQASKESLVGHIHPTTACLCDIYLSWNRQLEQVNSLGIWHPQNHSWLWNYHIFGAWPGILFPSSESQVPRILSIAFTHMEHAIQQFKKDTNLG
jgi:hypothetical protein